MKKKMPYVLAGILLMISLMCMACGSTQEATALPDDANESIQDEEDEDLQNDPAIVPVSYTHLTLPTTFVV